MVKQEKLLCCNMFFDMLCDRLDGYELIKSCNQDCSRYLVPKGTAHEVSYYGKPVLSFRVSDHWNWFSSTRKCSDPKRIQCFSVDMPWAKCREGEGKASRPVYGIQVAIYGQDQKYHHVFGERFDRETKSWSWETNTISEVIRRWIEPLEEL